MLARADASHSDVAAVATFAAVAAALKPVFGSNCVFTAVTVAAKGSNVFNPVAGFTPVTGTNGSTVLANDRAYEVAISGRSTTGRKSRIYFYGYAGARFTNFKQDPLTDAALQGFQGLLNSTSGLFLAIDETKPTWYFRATANYNSYWERAFRV
jgi:hypothetical protein